MDKEGKMHYINNLPVIMSAFSAIIIGLYGYTKGLPNVTVYKYMCICTIAFYLLGLLIKRTVVKTVDEIAVEKEKEVDANGLIYISDDSDEGKIIDKDENSDEYPEYPANGEQLTNGESSGYEEQLNNDGSPEYNEQLTNGESSEYDGHLANSGRQEYDGHATDAERQEYNERMTQ